MANALFDPGREGFLDGTINWSTGDIRAVLVKSAYVFSAAHKFLSDLGSNDNGRSAALATKTVASGVADAADTTLTATSAVACNALVVFQHTGADATARIIAYTDGRVQVQMAAGAASAATTITPEDLPEAIANGAVLTLISGTGPATITTSAAAAAGARALSVVALSGALSVDAIYEYQKSGFSLPFTPSASQVVNITWDNGANRIFKL